MLLADSRDKGLLEKNCLDSDLTCSLCAVLSICVFFLPHLILVFTRSIDLSFVGWSMLSLALTEVKLKLREKLGEATKL